MLTPPDPARFADPVVRDRARVLAAVLDGAATARPQLADHLGLRSTAVSHLVADLLARGLLLEASGPRAGRGRPAATLRANPAALGASVLSMASRTLSGTLVDAAGGVLHRVARPVEAEADNAAMARALAGLARQLRRAVPPGMRHAGTSVAVSGVVDARQGQWLVSSRWPRLGGLDLPAALRPAGAPVLVARQLEAELRARLQALPVRDGGTLLLHWGWGIGLAYALDGRTFAADGPFGEIGHWRLEELAGRRCGCGHTGCLETGAALWSLLPGLRQTWPALPDDEATLGPQLRQHDLLAHPPAEAAARLMARTLANLCRLLFPQRLLVCGPLLENEPYRRHFEASFREETLLRGLALPPLLHAPADEMLAVRGAAAPLLERAAGDMLEG